MLCVVQNSYASLLFRIQVGTYKQRETPENIKDIPNLGNFNLPQNYTALFSGGYFENYLGAKMRLNTIKSLGFEDAKLRVFRYDKLLSLIEGQKYIAKEELKLAEGKADESNINKQIYSLDRSASMENRQILFDEISIPPPTEEELAKITKEVQEEGSVVDNIKGKFVGFWSSSDSEETNESENNSSDDNTQPEDQVAGNSASDDEVVPESVVEEEPAVNKNSETATEEEPKPITEEKSEEEIVSNNESESAQIQEEVTEEKQEEVTKKQIEEEALAHDIDEEAHAMVEEIIEEGTEQIDPDDPRVKSGGDIPFFKIYLGSNVKGGDTPESIENLPEIVYVYDKKKVILYTVGYYGTSREAEMELARYRKAGFGKAKVVGIFRGIIISDEVAKAIVENVR